MNIQRGVIMNIQHSLFTATAVYMYVLWGYETQGYEISVRQEAKPPPNPPPHARS